MSGFYTEGKWRTATVTGSEGGTSRVEALEAVAEATLRVTNKESTALAELRKLLGTYPTLKQETVGDNPLDGLGRLYAEELLYGNPTKTKLEQNE